MLELTRREFKARYLGSYLGLMWAVINPIMTVLIFWFVFTIGGLRVNSAGGCPFVLWLLTGLVPWFLFSDGVGGAMTAIQDKAFLMKNIVFPAEILPIVRVTCAVLLNAFFIAAMFLMFAAYGLPFTVHIVQVAYYLAATLVLMTGISLITSASVVFVADLKQIVGILLQLGFWLTPIVWPHDRIPAKYDWVVKLNPLVYIVDGYREAFIDKRWFWEHAIGTAYFWSLAFLILAVGVTMFRRLRPHFADVL